MGEIRVTMEMEKKRIFAGAVDWPSWSRSGPDGASALQALADYGARYAHIIPPSWKWIKTPSSESSDFVMVERLEGDTTTDFGAPGKAPSADYAALAGTELENYKQLLAAYWQAFDEVVAAAKNKELRTPARRWA